MGHSVDDLQRIGVKFFFDGAAPDLDQVVPIFHRWIQNSSIDGLLIDVADYAHVPGGPGVMLIAFEGNFALDLSDGRPGLLYYRKQGLDGELAERLRSVCATTLRAALLLVQDPSLGGAVKIRGDEVQIVANDRLLAPNEDATEQAFQPALGDLLDRLYDGGARKLCRDQDPRQRFKIDVKAEKAVDVAAMLGRLS